MVSLHIAVHIEITYSSLEQMLESKFLTLKVRKGCNLANGEDIFLRFLLSTINICFVVRMMASLTSMTLLIISALIKLDSIFKLTTLYLDVN